MRGPIRLVVEPAVCWERFGGSQWMRWHGAVRGGLDPHRREHDRVQLRARVCGLLQRHKG